MKHLYLIAFLVLAFIFESKSQTISYYPFNSQLAISTKNTNPIFVEARIQMNSATSLITTEIGPNIVVSKKNKDVYYIGGGASVACASEIVSNTSNIKGYYASIGVRAYPFEKVSKLGLNFEVTPFADASFKAGLLRAWLGLSYRFN